MAHADEVMADALKDYVGCPTMSATAIAEKHGVSPSTLTVWAKKARIKLRGRGRESQRQPSARTREILQLAESLTLDDVGKRFGLTKQRVSRIVKRWKDWKKPTEAPFVVDDVVLWKGSYYKILETSPFYGKVVDQSGMIAHNFYWHLGGETAIKVDPSAWNTKPKPRKKVA